MPWTASGAEWREPWLPLVDTSRNVEAQQADPESTLNYVRSLIERRREFADAPYETLPSPPGVWAYARGDAVCVVNLSDRLASPRGSPARAVGGGGLCRLGRRDADRGTLHQRARGAVVGADNGVQ